MRASTLLAGLASAAVVLASDVVDLTKSGQAGFEDFVQDSSLALVEFYAPWVSPVVPSTRPQSQTPSNRDRSTSR